MPPSAQSLAVMLGLFALLFSGARSSSPSSSSSAVTGPTPDNPVHYRRYIVLGAGPAGLQMAHYLESAGRDYVVLDEASTVGSFFARYPRFRQLISVNKAHTGVGNRLDFVLRHDWNSLLADPSHSGRRNTTMPHVFGSLGRDRGDHAFLPRTNSSSGMVLDDSIDDGMLMRHLSDEYYPSADLLVDLLRKYAAHERLKIRLNTSVDLVDAFVADEYDPLAIEEVPDNARFLLSTSRTSGGSGGATYEWWACRYLLLATGMRKHAPPKGAKGLELADTYHTLPTNLSAYKNQRVLIVGRGNAALEVAHHIQKASGQIHVAGPGSRLKLAWESHYPGDIRQVHNRILESYQLKVLDGLIEIDTRQFTIRRDASDPTKLWATDDKGARLLAAGKPPCSSCPFRKPYDRIIVCTGWIYDGGIFTDRLDVAPALSVGSGKKYPGVNALYEALGTPGLYAIGTIAHSRDFKKTSGGFIHGFRYVVRAVHRILEEEERAERLALEAAAKRRRLDPDLRALLSTPPALGWPRVSLPHIRAVASAMFTRINHAGGTFQMFGTLADVFLLSPDCGFTHNAGGGASVDPADPSLDSIARDHILHGTRSFPSAPLCGWLFEEVPIAAVPALTLRWATELGLVDPVPEAVEAAASSSSSSKAKADPAPAAPRPLFHPTNYFAYITLTLEFGANATAPGKDPFSLTRAHVPGEHPDVSEFLHPIFRYHDSRVHVPHKRINFPGQTMEPWWEAAARTPPPAAPAAAAPPASSSKAPQRAPPAPPKPQDPHTLSMKILANEAVDVAEWTRIESVPEDASKLLRRAAASAVGPRPGAFITPVTEFHIIEDFSNVFDVPNRHIAPLLRFLEHTASARIFLEDRLLAEAEATAAAAPNAQAEAAAAEAAAAAADFVHVAELLDASSPFVRALLPDAEEASHAPGAAAPGGGI
jgi:hypothetical protein